MWKKQLLKANLEFVLSWFWIKPTRKKIHLLSESISKLPEFWAVEVWAHAKDVGGLHMFCFLN